MNKTSGFKKNIYLKVYKDNLKWQKVDKVSNLLDIFNLFPPKKKNIVFNTYLYLCTSCFI